jgi:hypothetical protein
MLPAVCVVPPEELELELEPLLEPEELEELELLDPPLEELEPEELVPPVPDEPDELLPPELEPVLAAPAVPPDPELLLSSVPEHAASETAQRTTIHRVAVFMRLL